MLRYIKSKKSPKQALIQRALILGKQRAVAKVTIANKWTTMLEVDG